MGVRRKARESAGETIWVVDDDDLLLRTTERGLRWKGFTDIHLIDTAEEAIERIAVEHPDLVIQDVKLGGKLDGVDVTNISRTRGFQGKILMYTADVTRETLFRSAIVGANDYIVKPETNDFICTEVRSVLDGRNRDGPRPPLHEAFKEGAYVRSRNGSQLEIDLLSEICRDYPTQVELAERLGKTPAAIYHETKEIRTKLGCGHYGDLTHMVTILEIFARRSLEDWE